MPKVSNPFGPGEIDTGDASGSVKSLIYGTLGMGLFFVLLTRGQQVGSWANAQLDSLIGTNTSGENPITRGEL